MDEDMAHHLSREELVEILNGIADEAGRLTPDDVVEAARAPDHPLHGRFIWDDAAAARAQRIATARRLIAYASVRVRHSHVTIAAPAFVRDPAAAPGRQGYRSTIALRSNQEDSRLAILAEMERIRSILTRARSLVLLLGREEDLNDLESAVESFVASLEATEPTGATARPS